MPKVSVIIPVYKSEKFIARTIDAILAQSQQDFELILIDDCGMDNSLKICKDYSRQDNRIKVIEQQENVGPMIARQKGIDAANGDYITFCDSDDILPKDAIESLYNLAIESGADIVSGDMEWLFDDGTTKQSRNSLPYGFDSEAVYRALLSNEYSHTLCSKMFKRGLLQEHKYITLMHATNGEDGMLFYQVLQYATKVVHQNKVVYSYFQNDQSSTHIRLKEHAIYSIIQLNKTRMSICGNIESLKKITWVYVSQVLNGLLADGYNKGGMLKKIIINEQMEEFINPLKMLSRYSMISYMKTMTRRILKPLVINK